MEISNRISSPTSGMVAARNRPQQVDFGLPRAPVPAVLRERFGLPGNPRDRLLRAHSTSTSGSVADRDNV